MVIFNGEYDDKPSNEPSNVEGLWGSSPKFSDAIFQLQVVGHSGQPLALASRLATKGCFFSWSHWDPREAHESWVDPWFLLISWGSTLIGIHYINPYETPLIAKLVIWIQPLHYGIAWCSFETVMHISETIHPLQVPQKVWALFQNELSPRKQDLWNLAICWYWFHGGWQI